jgi:hypothetical protein
MGLCKACYQQTWRKNNPETHKLYRIKYSYGLSEDGFNDLMAHQQGKCAICSVVFTAKGKTRPIIDHDHNTEEVRGLLCYRCNLYLTAIEDEKFSKAAGLYLERSAYAYKSIGGVYEGSGIQDLGLNIFSAAI